MKNEALLLTSSAPLPNELIKIKRLYWVCCACLLLGAVITIFFGIGILGLLIVYMVDSVNTSAKQGKLRNMVFLYDSSVSSDELLNRLQPELIAKYGTQMLIEKNEQGLISISFGSHIYDVHLGENDDMKIWWRKSLPKAVFSINEYKSYKQNLQAMGILVYEIQACCNLNGGNK